MVEIISDSERERWNTIVKSYKNWDIYYLVEYAESFKLHGDGLPYLVHYVDDDSDFCYVVMQKDIAASEQFIGIIEAGKYYDWETPYGYGGPLTDRIIAKQSEQMFIQQITEYCIKNRIVSQFFRFHPLLDNYNVLSDTIDAKYLRDTIYMDVLDIDVIKKNMDSKNRNMVRKAQKCGVVIKRKTINEYSDFIDIYTETMKRDNAEEYYFFNEEYFKTLSNLKDNACFFYAYLNDKPIGGSIFLYNNQFIHYHLSGTLTEYRKMASGNLLLYEVACWASQQGIKQFHLGGGMSPEDSLFGFKKQFNKNGRVPFYIGRTIFDNTAYEELIRLRKEKDTLFNVNNNFMIQYRG